MDCGNGPSTVGKDQGFVFKVGGTRQETYSCTRGIGSNVEACTNGYKIKREHSDIRGRTKTSQKLTAHLKPDRFSSSVDSVIEGEWSSISFPKGGRYRLTRRDQLDVKITGNACTVTIAGWNQRDSVNGKSHSSRLKRTISCSVS